MEPNIEAEALFTRIAPDERLRNTDEAFRQIVTAETDARNAKSERLRLARMNAAMRN